ncbi:hypothetical protein GGI35DRAFT_491934 [Trichoderma velutinum]
MRVVMIFILLCIKLGFPKFFKFYEFLKNRFRPGRRYRKRKRPAAAFHSRTNLGSRILTSSSKPWTLIPLLKQICFQFYQAPLRQAIMFYNRTEELEYYRNGMRNHPPTDLEFWASWFVFCSFISVITVCMMYPNGTWFQCVSGATLLYLFWQVVVNYVNCE